MARVKEVSSTYWKKASEASWPLVPDSKKPCKHPAKAWTYKLQLGGQWEKAKDALPTPSLVAVVERASIASPLDQARRPGKHTGTQALNGNNVHPFSQVNLLAR
ncbi:hypothetical protein CDD81_39 [Ophiocordyceps australis]|uniref:Uncharacterized protein n=1 Tax=Ophiocordyceps australis TaxID=1399860 RepID=A0A2C5XNG0_9HYPO|nr:hypothetical protein CDD81_39 [Ophiocordyceps australis]